MLHCTKTHFPQRIAAKADLCDLSLLGPHLRTAEALKAALDNALGQSPQPGGHKWTPGRAATFPQ
jgi:hypothetical protein